MTLKEICDSFGDNKTYRLTFYGLINDCGSWSVNQPWQAVKKATKEEACSLLNARLAIYRENYLVPRDQEVILEEIEFFENAVELECNGIPFANIEENE